MADPDGPGGVFASDSPGIRQQTAGTADRSLRPVDRGEIQRSEPTRPGLAPLCPPERFVEQSICAKLANRQKRLLQVGFDAPT